MILIKAIKNGKKFIKIEKPLYVYEENGELKLALFGDKLGDICGLILLLLLSKKINVTLLWDKKVVGMHLCIFHDDKKRD